MSLDAQGPNMSRAWTLDIGTQLLGIIREEREKAMAPQKRTFEEMLEIYPDWTGKYWVKGPFGDEVTVTSDKLDRMVENGETVNCTITRVPNYAVWKAHPGEYPKP